MFSETLDDTYFERMKSSLGDKARIKDFMIPGRVLDVGAGGGELSEFFNKSGFEATALDGSYAALERINETFPEINTIKGMADEIPYLVSNEYFDNVVCSSVLHEVYSYGTQIDGLYSLNSLSRVLKAIHATLKPGGRLIIRDGIMPDQWDKKVTIRFLNDDVKFFLKHYKNLAPFWGRDEIRSVNLTEVNAFEVVGNLSSAMEFLYTYTWGWNSSIREAKEFYGVLTEADYRVLCESVGFNVIDSSQYLQVGYYENLSKSVQLFNDEEPEPFPSSNFILIAEK